MKSKITLKRKFTAKISEAKELYKLKTGVDFDKESTHNGITIFDLCELRTKTKRYFVGTKQEWLNIV